ncbi:MAG: hypothetical protein M1503_03050 [Thaumarchaeota archaeon]|nr:hypothetical protein [Nitrososphaerota archaeon]MCL5317229.1 hypothetical protein [Nitrososphaerota archaeon]
MTTTDVVYLKAIPMVRRLEYLEVFLKGVRDGLERKDLSAALGEQKKAFEIEKDIALGRGKPHRKDITQANKLLRSCIRLSCDFGFVKKVESGYKLSEVGKLYLDSDNFIRRRMFAESFSEVYPHLSAIILSLVRLQGDEAILPIKDRPEFKPESEKYGFSTGQMYFDTVRDLGTSLGLINWYVKGAGLERRQHIYMVSQIKTQEPEWYLVKIHSGEDWLFAEPFDIDRTRFREVLWEVYLALADGVPGSPVFYSSVREQVCAILKLRDDQFDQEVMNMVNADALLQVIWSEGVLQYEKDSASMLKSLPPKNEWDRYVVYLKIVRR